MSVTGTKVEIGAVVLLADTEAAVPLTEIAVDHPAQAEIGAAVLPADTEAAVPLTEIAVEVLVEVTTVAATGAPAAAIEEVSAAEAADRQPPEGTLVTASTEEINLLLFFIPVLV